MEFRFLFYFKIKCLRIEPEFMVIDACKVIAYAIKKCFPYCKIIMCWFHLKCNIRKHKHLLRGILN